MKKITVLVCFLLVGIFTISGFSYFQGETSFAGEGYVHDAKYASVSKAYVVDVSSYNGNVDWAKVKASGIGYAVIRAGYCGYSSGENHTDTLFEQNYQGAKAAGLKVGAYYYAQPSSSSSATSQANYFLQIVNGKTFDMPLVLDLEYASENGRFVGKLYESLIVRLLGLESIINTFCGVIKNAGCDVMLYSSYSMLNDNIDLSKVSYPIWVAKYDKQLNFNGTCSMWQFTGSGSVDGISSNTDLSVLYSNPTAASFTVTVTQSTASEQSSQNSTGAFDTSSVMNILSAVFQAAVKLFTYLLSFLK